MNRGYRFRFYPTEEQAALLARTFGCVRHVWNRALQHRTDAFYERRERTTYNKASGLLTEWKKDPERAWLNEVSSVPLQQCLRHQQTAFTHFFEGRTRYPRFKSRHRHRDSAEFTRSAFRWDGTNLTLAKMKKPLAIRWSRPLPAGTVPSMVTVTRDPSGRWHVSILVEETIVPLPCLDLTVGIDAGIGALVTLSTGEKINNPKHYRRDLRRLQRASRCLARKQKGSNNRAKARVKVARVHARIADRRRDQLHKLTTRLVRENQTVVIEDLNVRNMVRNRYLSQAISDLGWGDFRRMLEYKCDWYGRDLVVVDRWFPSTKRCSECGFVVEKMPLDVRIWSCPQCETVHDRDVNAAVNIRAAGLAVLACGATVRPSRVKRGGRGDETGNPRA